MNIITLTLSITLVGISLESIGQTTKSEPIFGSVVERKIQQDSTKRKSSFHPLRPAFLRLGIMGGGLIGLENFSTSNGGSTAGIRVEYGLSNRWSLTGEIYGNRFEGTTFPRNQASLGVNWMPFKSRRLQPYFGLSGGIGDNGYRGRRGEKNGREFYGYSKGNDYNTDIQGFISTRTGLNYVVYKKIIATIETSYQLPFNNSSNGGLALRIGASYQFNKKIKN